MELNSKVKRETRRDAIAFSAALAVPAAATAAGKSKIGVELEKSLSIIETKSPRQRRCIPKYFLRRLRFCKRSRNKQVGGIREQTEFVLSEIDAC